MKKRKKPSTTKSQIDVGSVHVEHSFKSREYVANRLAQKTGTGRYMFERIMLFLTSTCVCVDIYL